MTAEEVTFALARHFEFWNNIIVPRSIMFANHEADLLVLKPSGWLEEVEIKVSRDDFAREFRTKADKHKRLTHGDPVFLRGDDFLRAEHAGHVLDEFLDRGPLDRCGFDWTGTTPQMIRKFWFAVPEDIKVADLLPAHAGLLVVRAGVTPTGGTVEIVKAAPKLEHARKITEAEQVKLARLGVQRYWRTALKEAVSAV